ncbi:MAG: BatD family protein [Xanthomonadales bacterium]
MHEKTRYAARRRRVPRLWILLAALLLAPAALAQVELELDRQRVVVGETVTLTFRTDDPQQSLEADFSALEADFAVLDRRTETQLSIVNGQQTAVVRLLLTVEPRRAGRLTIPAFDFPGARTAAVTLQVAPAPELAPGELPPVFIEVDLIPDEGPRYVHAQFGLVVRVFYPQNNLTEATISQPEPTPAAVRLLQETPYQAERGGQRYRVLERIYAVFPERSGTLEIPAMELSGRLVERGAGSAWQPAVRGRRIRVESDPLTLTIEPRPDTFTGSAWLPARELTLAQQISAADTLRVGEPVTRTVLIDAVGLEENMLVEPVWPELPDARLYPDKPQGITRDDGHWVLGHKEFRYAVVPEQAGVLVLPELRLDWWDTVEDRQRTAVLPAHSVQVQPSAMVPPPEPERGSEPVTGAPVTAPAASGATPARFWPGLTAAFAGLWLLTLGLWLRARRAGDRTMAVASRTPGDGQEFLERLKRACEAGDRVAARRNLRGWLRTRGVSDDRSLLDFAATVDDADLRDAVYALDAAGFRPAGGGEWDGRSFWRRFRAWRERPANAAAERVSLTDLYARPGPDRSR